MKLDKKDMCLYAVTDRAWLRGRTLSDCVEQAIQGGVTFLQLREKNLEAEQFLQEARQIKQLTDGYQIPFVINDNIDVALACDADGVHVGQEDLPVREVRRRIGPEKCIGVSVQTVQQACKAQEDGADYLGVGAVFSTSTKLDANAVSHETLRAICAAVKIPVVAIGGIQKNNVLKLQGTGIDGAAVVSAIFGAASIENAARELKELCERL